MSRQRISMKLRALLTSAYLSALFLGIYGFCNWFTSTRDDVGTWVYSWEHLIPFVPIFIVPYMSIDLFFVAGPFLCSSRDELNLLSRRITLAIVVAGAFFLLMPLKFTFERPPAPGWLGEVFDWFRNMDKPFNQFPSLHITLRTILADLYWRHTRGALRWITGIWFSLIGASTILVYQHHVIDIVGGFMLAAVCFYVVRPTPIRLPGTGNARVMGYYLAGCIALTALAIIGRPWTTILFWPAASCLVVVLGYLGLGAGIFRKDAGTIPLTSHLLLAPILLGQRLSLKHYAKGSKAWDEIAPRLWLGRWLNDEEASEAIAAGVSGVLDLTGELDENRPFRQLRYLNLPILDLTAPLCSDLDRAAEFVRSVTETGIIYVHCKAGYSRSGAVVGAFLIKSGLAKDANEAITILRNRRPGIIIRPEVISCLNDYASRQQRPSQSAAAGGVASA